MIPIHESPELSAQQQNNGSNGRSNGHANGHTNGHTNGADVYQETMLHEYMAILMRGKWTAFAVILLVLGATAAFTYYTKPVYEASSKVLIDTKAKAGTLPFLDITGTAATNKINNELETLTSRVIAEGVAQALIDRVYVDGGRKQRIEIIRELPAGEQPGKIASVETILLRLAKAIEFVPVRDSDVLRITARSNDPREAALLANTFMQVYTERNVSSSRVKSKAIREFLQAQLGAKHVQLDSNEEALQHYMKQSGVVSLNDEAKKLIDQLAQLEATRDAIDIDISSRQSTLASLKEELAAQEPNVAKAIGESNDAYIKLLQEQLAKLEVQRDVATAQTPQGGGGTGTQDNVYGDRMTEINTQIDQLKKNLRERTTAFLGSLMPSERGGSSAAEGTAGFLAQVKQRIIESQIELGGLKAKKTALNSVLRDYERQFTLIPEKSIDLAKLQRARLSSEKLYLLVEEKFNEAAISETSELGYLNIIDPAAVPLEPISPRPVQNMVLGIFAGFFLAITFVIARARLDDRIRTPEDLKRHGLAMLSTVARMERSKAESRAGDGTAAAGAGISSRVVTLSNPFSPVAEAYRHLRTNVQFAQPDAELKALMISSPNPKEGKSTTVSNLAVSFAQTERRVLLVDADMRRPTLHEIFGLEKEPGLTNVLSGQVQFEEVVNRQVAEKLDVLTCGMIPPNPAEILGSRRMKEFIEAMTGQYEIILFDTPPMLAVTDAAILARQVEGVIVVASASETTFGDLQRAGENLGGTEEKVLGIVLNNFDLTQAYGGYYSKRRYGYRYGYGYGYKDSKNGSKTRSKSNVS